jgi:catechol 2,3-dioxygenase-like lactoylglutathione lyase family enzyme
MARSCMPGTRSTLQSQAPCTMALQSLDHVVMFVPTVRAAAEWYSSALGLPIECLDDNFGYLRIGSSQLCFHVADEKASAGHFGQVAYWRVSSLAQTRAQLERAGAKLFRGPLMIGNGEAICQMSDPFGNLLGLVGTVADA